MRCTGFAVIPTNSIPLLSRAPVHVELHTSAYENGTDRSFQNVGIYKLNDGELTERKFIISTCNYT